MSNKNNLRARRDDELSFTDQTIRFKKIKSMIDSQGVLGPCVAFLNQKEYVLSNMLDKTNSAIDHEVLHLQYKGETTTYSERSRIRFEPLWDHLIGGIGFIKAFYRPLYHEVNYWGPTVIRVNKVVYPSKFEDRVAIYIVYYERNDSYGLGLSPLIAYNAQNNINIDEDYANVAQAVLDNNLSDTLVFSSIEERVARDTDFDPVWAAVLEIESFLMKLYKNNKRMLEKFGINIDSNKETIKPRKSVLLPEESCTIKGLIKGKKVKNNSDEVLYYQLGMKDTAPVLEIQANKSHTVTKGGTTIRFHNISATETIKFSTNED